MNPALKLLHPYPFEKLRRLLADLQPPPERVPLNLGIGEPQHPTPNLILDALRTAEKELGKYPPTPGSPALREAIAAWANRRYGVELDALRGIIPVSGTREALFGFAQAILDPAERPTVLLPNPFYQIYEGAALLAGAEPVYVPTPKANRYLPDWSAIPLEKLNRARLAYVCSPGNPTGAVLGLPEWTEVFQLADRHGFVIAADECYSEIYLDTPPLGVLEAAQLTGRGLRNLVSFNSLSKRSSCPGLRSGFVAGDPEIVQPYLLYRTYHGAAPSGQVQAGSVAAWSDETHVEENRAKYRAKLLQSAEIIRGATPCEAPPGSFFLWLEVPGGDDEALSRRLFAEHGLTVLPGRYLAREVEGQDPGRGHVRIACVPEVEACLSAARAIRQALTAGNTA